MKTVKEKILEAVKREEKAHYVKVSKDPYRLKFHLMPPVGWLNDPNGLCQMNGIYHVFFQYSPLDAEGGEKLWGHYTSEDLLSWKYRGAPILPDQEFDADGVYSGSSLVEDGVMHIFYTGNVKHKGNFDYIYSGREANTIYISSKDGLNFSEKVCVMTNSDYPSNYTNHIRDPKVWKEQDTYYMILGGRKKSSEGAVLLYASRDLLNWSYVNEINSEKPLGYMWECPDLFKLNKQCVLSLSPQGLKSQEFKYQNVYQSGYCLLEGDFRAEPSLGEFIEWDMGFDFYAPQSFLDEKGRRILIGWVGLPDISYKNPTTERGWQHALTVMRELSLVNNKILQYPIEEYALLRREKINIPSGEMISLDENVFDLEISNIMANSFYIKLTNELNIKYENGIFELYFSGESGYGRDSRKALIENISEIRVLVDTSMIELFINKGEYVFTTRYYYDEKALSLLIACENSQNTLWKLNHMEVSIEV